MEGVEEGINNIPQISEQFVEVKITAVGCGNENEPLKIVFEKPSGGKTHETVYLSGTNRYNSILTTGKHFDDVFSLTDPKLKFPNISATNWRMIQQSKVKIGMTERNVFFHGICDISSYSALEQWVYKHAYLYFKGNKLVHIQD